MDGWKEEGRLEFFLLQRLWLESSRVVPAIVEDAVFHHEVLVMTSLFSGNTCCGIVDEHSLMIIKKSEIKKKPLLSKNRWKLTSRRSRPAGSRSGTIFSVSTRSHWGKLRLKCWNDETPGQVFSSGVPRSLWKRLAVVQRKDWTIHKVCREREYCSRTYLKILKISSISESPWNNAFLVHISAKIQPTLHISTPVLYCLPPNKISGARYHNVTTSCV